VPGILRDHFLEAVNERNGEEKVKSMSKYLVFHDAHPINYGSPIYLLIIVLIAFGAVSRA
jgi:hypothetical protein